MKITECGIIRPSDAQLIADWKEPLSLKLTEYEGNTDTFVCRRPLGHEGSHADLRDDEITQWLGADIWLMGYRPAMDSWIFTTTKNWECLPRLSTFADWECGLRKETDTPVDTCVCGFKGVSTFSIRSGLYLLGIHKPGYVGKKQ